MPIKAKKSPSKTSTSKKSVQNLFSTSANQLLQLDF